MGFIVHEKFKSKNYNAFKYNESILDSLMDSIDPLFSLLGFNYFCYLRFMEGKQYSCVTSDPTLSELHFARKLEEYNIPEQLVIEENEKKVIFWDFLKGDPINQLMNERNYCHYTTIVHRKNNVIHLWGFAANRENTKITDVFLNHSEIINKFILYFSEKEKNLLNYNKTLFENQTNFSLDLSKHESKNQLLYQQFMGAVRLKKYPFKINNSDFYLSPSQFEILSLLSKNNSIKEIASQKNISTRTVENHLFYIKQKTDISHNAELIKFFRQNALLKL